MSWFCQGMTNHFRSTQRREECPAPPVSYVSPLLLMPHVIVLSNQELTCICCPLTRPNSPTNNMTYSQSLACRKLLTTLLNYIENQTILSCRLKHALLANMWRCLSYLSFPQKSPENRSICVA